MLAKLWKKILLAICIIACIFNIMSKLVNRHSLKENLESVNDGVTVFDLFKKEDVKVTESEMIIDGVVNKEEKEENTISNTSTPAVVEENTSVEETTNEEVQEPVVEEKTEEKDDKTFNFSDFTIIF